MGFQLIVWLAWLGYWLWAARKTKPVVSAESKQTRWAHLAAVAVSFFLLFGRKFHSLHFINARYLPESTVIILLGLAITIASFAFAVWARRHLGEFWSGRVTLKEGHELIRTGPYRWVRHPIYTGVFFGVVGTALSQGEIRGLLAVAILFTAFHFKMQREESVLVTHFGEAYRGYQSEVNALIPDVRDCMRSPRNSPSVPPNSVS